MITIRAGKAAIGVCLLLLAGCSREQQDWRSAEAADSIEAYDQFIQRHPESELAAQAHARVAQLGEDRDWQHAGSADTADAYRDFVTQHPNGKWAQEARIRIENFSLGEQGGSGSAAGSAAPNASPGVRAAPAAAAPPAGATLAVPAGGTADVAAASPAAAKGPRGARAAPAAATAAATHAAPAAVTGPAVPAAPAAGAPRAAACGVQLGAFSSESAAKMEWHLLSGRFGPELQGLSEHVVMAETASGRIYRLQALVGDESRARAICDSLRKSSQACVAVLPH